MTVSLNEIIELSRFYGANPEIVLAGGGNTSVKDADTLWVKASGCSLATIDESGFVELDRSLIGALLESEPPADEIAREAMFKDGILAARSHPDTGRRPSVEAALHHLLPSKYVVHSHATLVNMVTCSVEGERLAREWFGDEVLWVPYVDPGYTLARLVKHLLEDYCTRAGRSCPEALLMANHGLIVCGDTVEEIRSRTDRILAQISSHLPPTRAFGPAERLGANTVRPTVNTMAPALRGLLGEGEALKIVAFDDSDTAISLAGSPDGEAIAGGGPLTPDQIVYCKSFPLWFKPDPSESPSDTVERLRSAVKQHTTTAGFPPKIVIAEGVGIFAAGDTKSAADTVKAVYLDAVKVMAGAKALGGIRYMAQRDREFIDNWEVENYRRGVSAGSAASGRVAGKVAVVTGAAQGFGAGIAEDLAAQGAHVVLADINAEGVQQAANALAGKHGAGRAMGVTADVTDDASLAAALHAVVRAYGGFDVFISNAGVLRAASVKAQNPSEFEFVTRVNYVGYFVCVHNAAPIMAVQNLAQPDAWTDIIQINSKSGLAGSNRNAAYAGGKFGGIGLTQSFALELIDDGIKVNSICPGNFFDGPLWSDPKNGLFAQYLKAGKAPGAKTTADVKAWYEAKVPMGRGCTVADVMKAVYYVIDQKYETGQAVPVTGGQVMLR
jgi:rhamnose utilization protein RhaD (predicted bifunctional aldolase and dehydrogenase)/NAD(P)-dependent dehydrogenase (short-subunit alcohol dehydrogenase family)